jgi:hypothetical protein
MAREPRGKRLLHSLAVPQTSARVCHRRRRPAPCKVMKCELPASTDVPVITAAPARDEHDF